MDKDKDNLGMIEMNIRKRKELLLRRDIDEMEKEYMVKKEKCDVKVIRDEIKEEEKNFSYSGNLRKVKGKKKVKDIIELDIPLKPIQFEESNQQGNKSLFGKHFDKKRSEIGEGIIQKDTGLPGTFALKEGEMKEDNIPIKKMDDNIKVCDNKDKEKNKNVIEVKNRDDFYTEISKSNIEKIKSMSQKEIEDDMREIMTKIPTSLINKMKTGYFSNQFKKKFNKENTQQKETQKVTSNEPISIESENILFNYEGKTKLSNKSIEIKQDKIDFTKLNFNQMELSNKYFSLNEVYNFLSSSNVAQITLGLKMLYNLLSKELYRTVSVFSKQIYSFINALYFLIDHNDINVTFESLKCFSFLLKSFFYKDYKLFKYNLCSLNALYSFKIIHNYDGMNKDIKEAKMQFIKLIQNNNKDFYRLILHNDNKDINFLYKEVLFYFCYVNSSNSDVLISKISKDGDICGLSKNQKLMKLLIILGKKENIKDIEKYINNKYYMKYIFSLRGVREEIQLQSPNKNKNKIYYYNFLLCNYGENDIIIAPQCYLDENDYIILAKILLYKLNYSLNKNNNSDEDDYLPMFTNDLQLRFFEDKYTQCISLLKSSKQNNCECDYYTITSLYYFIGIFFLFWYKSFKYPKIVSFRKLSITLDDIISLFPIVNLHLDIILNKHIRSKDSKNEKIECIYIYQSLLILILNFIRCFIKNHDEKYYIRNFSIFLIKVSELINKGDEYFYSKYVKYVKNILSRKYTSAKSLIPELSIDFNELEIDMNFYLYSNEEVRKSTYAKKIFLILNNTQKLDDIIFVNIKEGDSKYFPFDQNFIAQIIANDKAKSNIKISYLTILILLWYEEDFHTLSEMTPFEISLRLIINCNLKEFAINTKLISIFEKFICNIVLHKQNGVYDIAIKNNASNKMLIGKFFDLFEENINFETMGILYKMVIIILIFIHCDISNKEYIDGMSFKRNLETVCYENMNEIAKIENSFADLNCNEDIINFLINNISPYLSSLYYTLIMTVYKYKIALDDNKGNILVKYIAKMILFFELKDEMFNDDTKVEMIINSKLMK